MLGYRLCFCHVAPESTDVALDTGYARPLEGGVSELCKTKAWEEDNLREKIDALEGERAPKPKRRSVV